MNNQEIALCAESFLYFSENYLKILHPAKGLVPLTLYDFQKRYISHLNEHRFTIATKFRRGGFTTTTLSWLLWRFLFKTDETNMVLCHSDRSAIECSRMVRELLQSIPESIAQKPSKQNDHILISNELGNKIHFRCPVAAKGTAIDNLIIEDAAFIKDMERTWTDLFPCISNGRVIVISTPNGKKGWFYNTYVTTEKGENSFTIFKSNFLEHPDYQNSEYVKQLTERLGVRGFRQEILTEFLDE